MDAVTVFRQGLEEVCRGLLREMEGLRPEHLTFRPTPEANSIAFVGWHILRTLDNAAHQVVPLEARPPLWEREGWNSRFGLRAEERGTGFTAEQVGRFTPPLDLLLAYGRRVGEAIAPAFASLTEADLDRVVDSQQGVTLGRRLLTFVLGHTTYHLGEVRFLKGLQGMPFPR